MNVRESPPKVEVVASVQRALDILEFLADSPAGASFTHIVDRLGVNKAIAFKLINTLLHSRYLFRDEHTGKYFLTFRLSNLGLRKMAGSLRLNQSTAVLRQLADETGELVRLAVVEGKSLTWVSSILGVSRVLQLNPDYSFEVSLHLHAAGKAWLSTLSNEEALRLVLTRGLTPRTEHSLTTADEILIDLNLTRERGYAISYEEHSMGVGAIGVPVVVSGLDRQPICVAVVTVAAPTVRMDRAALNAIAPRMLETAQQLATIWPLGEPRIYP